MSILDKHAPLKSRSITIRRSNPWYSPEIEEAKKLRKRLERKWRKTRLEVDRELFKAQRQRVYNFVTLSRKSCHITPILKELHWLPVSQRIVFKRMLIVHKSVNNIAPIYISELLKVYTPSRNLRSSNMSLLKEPTSKRTWGDRSFSVAAPRLWNHLPTKLKSCHSITRFKSLLKTHLMSQFFKDDVYL